MKTHILHVCKSCPGCGVHVLCLYKRVCVKLLTGERKKDILGKTATTT